jgi:CheY-like chemotaxis protein
MILRRPPWRLGRVNRNKEFGFGTNHQMTIDSAIKVLDAVFRLLSVLVWPAVLVFVLIRFGSALREFIASVGEFSLKGAGFEASAKRKAEAGAALAAASVSHAEAGAAPEDTARDARAAAQVVAEIVTPRMIRRAGRAAVLWVDDRPSNNVHERQALEALGVTFVLATSTDEALEKLKGQSFDAIISDMGRASDSQAGYTLLDKLRAGGNQTPFIIYAGSRAPEHRAEARRRGAVGCTNRPDELFEMVLAVLGQGREA